MTCSGAFVVNFEHVSQLFPVFLLLNLNNQMLTGWLLLIDKYYSLKASIQENTVLSVI